MLLFPLDELYDLISNSIERDESDFTSTGFGCQRVGDPTSFSALVRGVPPFRE